MFTDRQIELVRTSFTDAAEDAESFAAAFYDRLFAEDEKTQSLFKRGAPAQNMKFGAMLSTIVSSLKGFDALREPLRELGADHERFGVEPDHYAAVSRAIIGTLADGLGDEWSDEHARAWRAILAEVIAMMRDDAIRLQRSDRLAA